MQDQPLFDPQAGEPPLLTVDGFAISVGSRRLLAGVNLSLRQGERVAMMGPSGCGKTLLLRAIAGLMAPDRGELALHGRPTKKNGWPEYRRRVLYVHQKPALLDETVQQCLARPFRYATSSGDFARAQAEQALTALGLDREIMEQPARTLSVGEQQRVALVRALLVEPEVMLLDEPTGALDASARAAVESLLSAAGEQSRAAMLIVTHDVGQAERLCARTIDLMQYADRAILAAQSASAAAPFERSSGDLA
jgi:ABC-type iron transport system FetAB ATPase subunit